MRGYAIVHRRDGTVVDKLGKIKPGEVLDVRVSDGVIDALVRRIKPDRKARMRPGVLPACAGKPAKRFE